MKVKDLIEELKKLPMEDEIYYFNGEYCTILQPQIIPKGKSIGHGYYYSIIYHVIDGGKLMGNAF